MAAITQAERIVRFLREHEGCTILELTLGLDPFVANPRARISDARDHGYVIEVRRVTDTAGRKRARYYLTAEPERAAA